MNKIQCFTVKKGEKIDVALKKLNDLSKEKILFVVDGNKKLFGSISDGDIRRSIIKNKSIDLNVEQVCQRNPKFITNDDKEFLNLLSFRDTGVKIIPILDKETLKIKKIINFNKFNSYLPLEVVIMAGGKGKRLGELTKKTPKPLLPVGGKPIMEHQVERLKSYGVENFWFCINYLGEMIKSHFKKGSGNVSFNYIKEKKYLGTIGGISDIDEFKKEDILISNSDLITNLNYEDFYLNFLKSNADMSVVTIPYDIKIPYGVLECKNNSILNIVEKPTYTHFSNAGIYLIKKKFLKEIKKQTFLNATDLIKILIEKNKKVISYPFNGYWLDIGNPDDYNRARNDFNNSNLK